MWRRKLAAKKTRKYGIVFGKQLNLGNNLFLRNF
jgi:hypothetical protein